MNPVSLIPRPVSQAEMPGSFKLAWDVVILFRENEDTASMAELLREYIYRYAGYSLSLGSESSEQRPFIRLAIENRHDFIGNESYGLSVAPGGVYINGASKEGLFRGIYTFLQIISGAVRAGEDPDSVPAMGILDYPRFSWRGMNLDCSRHFMTVEFVKRYIDILAYYKMNVLHWHLTDDQGWRIEIKKYPRLTETGAWRKGQDGSLYGGYYTQDDLREVVAYAASRFVKIVPEIDMPGHCAAALAAYPELSCTGRERPVETRWGIFEDVYCAGKEETFSFLEDVLSEVLDIFPGRYIHLGGDECVKRRWRLCPRCRARIREEGLKDEEGLQGYFMKRMAFFLQKRGRTVIGWDEVLEGGLSEGVVVQSWRGFGGALKAAGQGHCTIVSPFKFTYFDYPAARTDLKKVYGFDPVPLKLDKSLHHLILGTEANMWTERAPQEAVDSKMFPRLLALAEVAWSHPGQRSFTEFLGRVRGHYRIFRQAGVGYGKESETGFLRMLCHAKNAGNILMLLIRNPGRAVNLLKTFRGVIR